VKTARRALIGFGALLIAYAISGALTDADLKGGAWIFLVAVLVIHDALLLPLFIGVGVLIGRVVPPRSRAPVRVAAVISLAVTVVALPLVLGRGRVPDNPSILPLHYGRGLLVVYAAVWATAAGFVVARRYLNHPGQTRSTPRRSTASPADPDNT
jgi:hypothetical protein